jgi:hypothetical protein
MLGLRRVEGVAAAGADAQGADRLGIDVRPGGQKVDGAANVLDPGRGMLAEVRLAAALAVVGRVERERDAAGCGQRSA